MDVGRMASGPLLAFVALMDVDGELGLGLCARKLGCLDCHVFITV